MPERPDLEYTVPILARELAGAVIEAVRIEKPVVLRVAVRGDFATLLAGRAIETAIRRGHFVRLPLRGDPPLELCISPMLAGRFELVPPPADTVASAEPEGGSAKAPRRGARAGSPAPAAAAAPTKPAKPPRDLAVAFRIRGGGASPGVERDLWYRDDVQMGKVYLVARGDSASVPGLSKIGLDVLDPAVFTRDAFRAATTKRREQAKVFLMDKSILDAMGNAYADEVLFAAGIHPKTPVYKLAPADVDRLHDAIVGVLSHACEVIRRRRPPLPEKVRDFLSVRGRPGEPCVRCGTKLRKAGVHGHDAIFCPECQPDGRPRAFLDWRRLDKTS